jgi:hypothetical protein
MTQSTEPMMGDSDELLSYLTTTKISNGSWRGTTKTFVLNWIDKLRLHHELTPVADGLSENTQRTLLQNAVIGWNALRQVQINSDFQQATRGSALTFAQYRTLLINLPTGYDKRSDKPNSNGKPRRLVFSSETLFGDHNETLEFDYDMDTTADKLKLHLKTLLHWFAHNYTTEFDSIILSCKFVFFTYFSVKITRVPRSEVGVRIRSQKGSHK